MTDDDRVLYPAEAAELLRVPESVVRAMGRDGRIKRVPPSRPVRYLRSSVERLLEDYDGRDESHGQASAQATASGRRNGHPKEGPLARHAVGSGSAIPGRGGPAASDVVVRRVER